MLNEQAVEQEIQAKGLNAARLTPALIDSVIKSEQYHVFEGTTLTVCCLTLSNGFTVTGESACASPENFNVELGRKIAKDNAREKIWALEGYLLRSQLQSQNGWGCADCLAVFSEGIPKTCPHNAIGCAELLAQGK